MEFQPPHLIIAELLVRGSQQRFPEEQNEKHAPERHMVAIPRAAWRDRLRLVIAGALVVIGRRLMSGSVDAADSQDSGPTATAGTAGTGTLRISLTG